MNTFLLHVFQTLERAQIHYCLLRGARHLDADLGEIDILIQDSDLARASTLLRQLGFLTLPGYGYAPHRFFVAYDRQSDQWIKLDVVDKVTYGAPIPTMQTRLGEECLRHRQREGDVFVPSPACELVTLLLHCVFDKGRFTDEHIHRLQTLRQRDIDEALMANLLHTYWVQHADWAELAQQIDDENWTGLLRQGTSGGARLKAQRSPITALYKFWVRGQRKLNRWITSRSPRSIWVALLAPDGAGKSTLVEGVCATYPFPVRSIYMGLYQKRATPSRLTALPGVSFALRLLSLWWRCIQASYHHMRRRLVLFDRYTYDARLAPRQATSQGTRWRRRILAHACPAPDLVILLDAPGELLYARKGEHSVDLLEHQRQEYLNLRRVLPQLKVVDAARDVEEVRRDVISLIWNAQVRRHKRSSESQIGQVVEA